MLSIYDAEILRENYFLVTLGWQHCKQEVKMIGQYQGHTFLA
jgi:hypothetical protein